jgi:RimJ/RimL family protein N-acetyltransferase
MKLILESERLRMREFAVADSKFILELVNTPGWLEFIGDRNIKSEEKSVEYLENGPLKSYEENGYGLYMVELKTNRTPIGMCGIIKRPQLEKPDIGFAFLPEYFGQGFAYEIANATMIYSKEQLKLPVVYAITVPANKRSINLLEKIGMQFKKMFRLPDGNEELMLFSNEEILKELQTTSQ